MLISFMMLSGTKTSSRIHIGDSDPIFNENCGTKWNDIEDFSTNASFSQVPRYTNVTYYSNYVITEDYKAKGRCKSLTENIHQSFSQLLLHNEKDSKLLDTVLVTKTDDIVRIIEKLKNFSKSIKPDCKSDFKIEIEGIQKNLNTAIARLQSDWNTLNIAKKQKLCVSKSVIKEISEVKHVLYKLIEIFWTVKYQINLIISEEMHQHLWDIYSLFNKLFEEQFSINRPLKYFKNLEEFVTRF